MKKILIFIMILMSLNLYSQIDYPRYETDSLGQPVIVLTIEQAQALDNSTDLVSLFKKLNNQIINYDSITIKVINEKEEIIAKQDVQISLLKKQLDVKDATIKNLNDIISKKDSTIANLDKQVVNVQNQLEVKKKEVKNLKGKMVVGGSLSGLAIIGLIIIILFP